MAVFDNALAFILANYADVIEGGNAHRGSGTAYLGIPGRQHHQPVIDDNAVVQSAVALGSTTIVQATTSITTLTNEDVVKSSTPPLFLLFTVVGDLGSPLNVGAARKISAYDPSTRRFTVAAFPAAIEFGDFFELRQGFKRAPDKVDIDDVAGAPDGSFDRFFSLRALPGELMDWFGDGMQQYRSTMELRLRIEKRGREQKAIASALENLAIIRSIITRGDQRDGTYTQLLKARGEAERVVDNATMIVLRERYDLIYRTNRTFL